MQSVNQYRKGRDSVKRVWKTPETDNYILFEDMLKQSHLLIAGATGSGKSVLENGLITTALKDSPAAVQFILIDPKMTELQEYAALPHTLIYADSERPEKMIEGLNQSIEIMMQRFSYMKRHQLKDYVGGHIYVIIDELADLMTTHKKDVTPLLQRISQLGRAAHVHLIACTQSPLATVIPTPIKVNFDSRVGLRTATAQDSRNILDVKGCELLPNPRETHTAQGYYRQGGTIKLWNIPMYPPEETARRVAYWKQQKPRIIWNG